MKKVVALILVAALVLTGVASGAVVLWSLLTENQLAEPGRDVAVAEPGSKQAPSADLAPFYAQDLQWDPCSDGIECSWLDVPMDYDDPDGETILVAVVRVLALKPDQRVGSLVVNPGGPGASGREYAVAAPFRFGTRLRDHFDIVGFDPRGTGASNPVDCLSDEEFDEYVAGDPSPDTPEEVAEFGRWVDRFAKGCTEKTGELVRHVSTVEAARDMDVLRAALGHSQLDYFGASYGTKLGATYAELFPAKVGHFVLDAGVDVSSDSRELSLAQARGFETALRAYVGNCVDGGDCQLGESVDEGVETIAQLLEDIADDPLPAGDRELGAGNAFYGVVTPLYLRESWPELDAALGLALDGDGRLLMRLSDRYTSRGEEGYLNNSSEAIVVINCLDDPTSIPVADVPEQFAEFEEASPTFGRVFAWGMAGCGAFGFEEPRNIEITGAGANPILVTGTTRDPATPMEWAESLAEQLESGVLIRRDGDGHTAYNTGNACVDEAVEGYLVDGDVPADGLDC